MNNSKRTFLKVAGISALGLGAGPIWKAFAAAGASDEHAAPDPEFKKNSEALLAHHWGMVIDTRKIEENPELMHKMQEACHTAHNVPDFLDESRPDYDPDMDYRHEIKWIWEEEYKHAFPNAENHYMADGVKHRPFPVLCNHCEEPSCVRVCPTKATFKRDDGIVLMDFHRCIGCRFCMAACPYGSRSFNYRDPRTAFMEDGKIVYPNPAFPSRMKGVVEKCNFCAERLAVGKQPACAEVSEGAIVVGDMEDPESEVRTLLGENYTIRRKPNLGTGPSVYYIV